LKILVRLQYDSFSTPDCRIIPFAVKKVMVGGIEGVHFGVGHFDAGRIEADSDLSVWLW